MTTTNYDKVIELDGDYGDLPGFLSGFAKAAGVDYWGKCFLSMHDCFVGGFGLDPPYTIRWRNSHLAVDMEPFDDSKTLRSFIAITEPSDPDYEILLLSALVSKFNIPTTFQQIVEVIVRVEGIKLHLE